MRHLRLVQITQTGSPEEPETLEALSDRAKEALASTAALYRQVGFNPPWVGYLAVVKNRCVGTCAFKSAPRDDRVEIAYCTFPELEKSGYATMMVRSLIEIAENAQPGIAVIAQTLPEKNASNAILVKLGFRFNGEIKHPEDGEVWEWSLQTGKFA